MKTTILTLSLLVALCTASFAQCDKKLVLNSSKTEHLDASGAVQKTVDETAKIEINKTDLLITINNDHQINGKIKSNDCNWKVPYKDGKTVIKAVTSEEGGDGDKNVTITIEGKDGKVTLLFEMEGMTDDRIRVVIDKFEEVK